MFSARKRFAPSDLEGLHVPCEWMEGLGRCELGRPLIVCAPCIGINNGGRFLQEVGVCYKLTNSCDILSNLSDALMALEGSLEGIKLGESGDITQIKLEDLTVPVDVLMAGPPCPPWASNGKKCPGDDVRTRVFLAVLLWTPRGACSGDGMAGGSFECCRLQTASVETTGLFAGCSKLCYNPT